MFALESLQRPLLLDGGLGRELRFRGIETPPTIWSAHSLLVAPDVVRQIHLDYILAGADIITTNTYGIIRRDLAKIGIKNHFAELNSLACKLAVEARSGVERPVLMAGSLPPLRGSYRPDLVAALDDIEPLYLEQAELLTPHVDPLLCETMSSAAEGRAAIVLLLSFRRYLCIYSENSLCRGGSRTAPTEHFRPWWCP